MNKRNKRGIDWISEWVNGISARIKYSDIRVGCSGKCRTEDKLKIDKTQIKYNSEKANNTKHSKTKLTWFNRLLQITTHRKRGQETKFLAYSTKLPSLYTGQHSSITPLGLGLLYILSVNFRMDWMLHEFLSNERLFLLCYQGLSTRISLCWCWWTIMPHPLVDDCKPHLCILRCFPGYTSRCLNYQFITCLRASCLNFTHTASLWKWLTDIIISTTAFNESRSQESKRDSSH